MGLLIDRIREITGLVKVASRLYVTPWIDIPGIAAADAFDANDAVGNVFEIPVPKFGIIREFKLLDPSDVTLALTAHIFDRRFTGAASDAAFTIGTSDARAWVTSATFNAPVDLGGIKVAEVVGTSYYLAPSGVLYCQCSTTGTPTITAGYAPAIQLCIELGV